MRPQEEIDEQLNRAFEAEERGSSQWPGMTYEDGVKQSLLWVTGASQDPPMQDD